MLVEETGVPRAVLGKSLVSAQTQKEETDLKRKKEEREKEKEEREKKRKTSSSTPVFSVSVALHLQSFSRRLLLLLSLSPEKAIQVALTFLCCGRKSGMVGERAERFSSGEVYVHQTDGQKHIPRGSSVFV